MIDARHDGLTRFMDEHLFLWAISHFELTKLSPQEKDGIDEFYLRSFLRMEISL